MDLQEARELARKKMKGCFVCPECDGKACKGMIPGFGGLRTAKTFLRNVEALAEYGLVMRSMDSAVDPNPAVTIFGKEISMPVLVAPVGGVILNSKVPGDPATVEWIITNPFPKAPSMPAPCALPVTAAWNTCLNRES